MNTIITKPKYRSIEMERIDVGGAVIEYLVQGKGEPVLLIPPSLTIDGLGVPLLAQPELASRYQLIHYHRRGYMGSTIGSKPLTFSLEANDAAELIMHLGLKTAHIAGYAMGAGIALQLAFETPHLVHSLALLEPALPMAPGGKERLDSLFHPVINAYRTGNKQAAIEIFCDAIYGPDWQTVIEHIIPGGVNQGIRDVDVFIQEHLDKRAWQYGPTEAATILQPVLLVMGTLNRPWMEAGRNLIHAWFPQAQDLVLATTHLLPMQDPQGVARGMAAFFMRHPIEPTS